MVLKDLALSWNFLIEVDEYSRVVGVEQKLVWLDLDATINPVVTSQVVFWIGLRQDFQSCQIMDDKFVP